MIHLYTSNAKAQNRDTTALLDAIMAALCDQEQSGLREFAARCLSEFIQCAISS